ncbi:MAG: hypothetical protein ACXWDN_02955, partial [Limisphaerales bacterium]
AMGWYVCLIVHFPMVRREVLRQNAAIDQQVQTNLAYLNEQRKGYSESAEPWQASTASIALAGLKHLDKGEMDKAEFQFSSLVATYYRAHAKDGDSNLLERIEIYAATNKVLSNAIYATQP